MTVLKRVIIGLLTLIVLIVVIGVPLPRQVHVERSIVINAPQAQLMRLVGLMFDKWIGGDYEKGLARMKPVMEQGNAG